MCIYLSVSHSNTYVVVYHCFSLYFPKDICCAASFHMFIFHLYNFFGDVFQIFWLYFNWNVHFYFFKSSLCILVNYSFSDVFCKYIFPVCGLSSHSFGYISFCAMCAKSLSCVQLFVIPWTVALQGPLSMGIL